MMRVDQLHPLAQCKKGRICDYTAYYEDDKVIAERCDYCGRKQGYNKDPETGRIDNEKYARINVRRFVQPYGAMRGIFEFLYGSAPISVNKKYHVDKARAAQKKQEIALEAREIARFLYRNGGSV